MTTDTNLDNQPLNLDAELSAAFVDKSSQQQQETGTEQQTTGEVESPESSSSELGTTPSSSDTRPLTKEALLASLTIEDIKSHAELGRIFQSEADKVAAGKLQGTEARLRNQINLEVATRHFASLSPAELADEISTNPEAAKMYSHVVASQPTAPDPQVQARINQWSREIRTTETRLNNSGLDEKLVAELNPNIYLVQPGRDPDQLLEEWKSKVEDAVIDAKVAKKTGTVTKTNEKANELNSQAASLGNDPDPMVSNGTRSAPAKDFMNTRSDVLLSDAFEAASRRR